MRAIDILLTLSVLALVWTCSKSLYNTMTETPTNSWEVYCEKYGVDRTDFATEEYDYYLDAYIGSTEEEEDMQHYGITEY